MARNYAFLAVMLGSMILGAIVGWIFPQVKEGDGGHQAGATVLKPLGTLFLNMMFCIVVPMVFSSIAGSVATMKSRRRAGKIMGTTVLTFVDHRRHRRSHHDRPHEAHPPGAGALEQPHRRRGRTIPSPFRT